MLKLIVRKYCYSLKRRGIVVFELEEAFFIHDLIDGHVYKIPQPEMIRDGMKIQLQHPITTYLLDSQK